MDQTSLHPLLTTAQKAILDAVHGHAVKLLDHTPRFKYFTLHGKAHLANLFQITSIFQDAGLKFSSDEAFLFGCSICVHDLGMVVALRDMDVKKLLWGKPQSVDPANLELEIRNTHHDLIDVYIDRHFDFLSSLGINAGDMAIIRDIAKCHRKVNLEEMAGYAQALGALLRVVDELDIYPNRAPSTVFDNLVDEMDATSCWHWFKHNIAEVWRIGHNVNITNGPSTKVTFTLAAHPPRSSSVPYWLNQLKRPIAKVLLDEGAGKFITQQWGIQVSIETSHKLSTALSMGSPWADTEQKALSAGRKVILVIDDEVRKLEDLLLPLMQTYHVIFSPNAADAFDKLAATEIDLAIVDLQVSSGFQWSAEETQDYKMTGLRVCKEIRDRYPNTAVGILTGSRHDLSEVRALTDLRFLLQKPVDPDDLEREVRNVLA